MLAALAASVASAATYYWDVSAGEGNGVGGSGSFSTSLARWSASINGDASPIVLTSPAAHDLVFAGTPGAVRWDSNMTATSYAFAVTGYSLTSNNLTARIITGPITLADGVNLAVSGVTNDGAILSVSTNGISGGAGSSLTLAGSNNGTMVFDLRTGASIAASVPITVTAQTGTTGVVLASLTGTGTVNSTIVNDGAVPLTLTGGSTGAGSGTLTLNGRISGSAGVNFNAGQSTSAAGQIQLGAANTYAGDSRFVGLPGAISSATAGSVRLLVDNALSPSSALIMGAVAGRGENLDLNGRSASVPSLTSGPGTGAVFNSAASTTGTLTINGSSSGVFGLVISNGSSTDRRVALVRAGNGTTTLTNVNTYTGGTTVSGGTLILGHGNNTLSDTGAVNVSGGILDIGSNTDTVGAVTISSGSIIGTGTLTGTSYAATGSGTINANLAGTGGLTTSGVAGTLVLGGVNTYSGNTTQNAVSNVQLHIRATRPAALSPNSQFRTGFSSSDTGQLQLAAAGDYVMHSLNLGGAINVAGPADGVATLTFANGGFMPTNATRSVNVSANATVFFGATVGNSTFDLVGSAATADRSVHLNGTGDVVFNSILRDNASGAAAGYKGGVLKSNTGVATLRAANIHTGGVSVGGGLLLINNTEGSGTGTGPVAVTLAGTLGGTGSIRPSGVNGVVVAGSLAPGAPAVNSGRGTLLIDGAATTGPLLTLSDGAALNFDLAAGDAGDRLRIDNYEGASDFVVSGNVTLNFTGAAPGTYTLVRFFSDNGATPAASGVTGGLLLGQGLDGYTATLNYNTSDITLTVATAAPLNALQTWRQANFGVTANEGDAADAADPDFDGQSNLLEFALGTSPLVAGPSPVSVSVAGGALRLDYSRPVSAAASVSYVVEWTDSLAPAAWSSAGVTSVTLSDNGAVQQVRSSVTLPAGTPARFLRLRVTAL